MIQKAVTLMPAEFAHNNRPQVAAQAQRQAEQFSGERLRQEQRFLFGQLYAVRELMRRGLERQNAEAMQVGLGGALRAIADELEARGLPTIISEPGPLN